MKARSPVAYSPWILTPAAFHAPTEMSGTPGDSAHWNVDGWSFEMMDVARADPAPSKIGWAKPQPREPMPGQRLRPKR